MEEFFEKVKKERQYQIDRGWRDENNTAHGFVCYIVNYASRFAMGKSFDTERYSFENCMVKVAALALAGWQWKQAEGAGKKDELDVSP